MQLISFLRTGGLFLFDLRMVVTVSVAVELPNINSIVFGCRNYHSVVKRIEHSTHKWVSVTDESLEKEGNSLLSIVVPKFK